MYGDLIETKNSIKNLNPVSILGYEPVGFWPFDKRLYQL
jgi:hypothetical protein